MVRKLLLIAAAGALGTLSRYGLAGFTHRFLGSSFPWGTLTVNVTGCFAAGLLWSFFETRWSLPGEARVIVMMGFLGAFTTFSAFILETGELMRGAELLLAAANLFLQSALGITALFAGMLLARLA